MFSNSENTKAWYCVSLYITFVKLEHTSYDWLSSINEISSIKSSNNIFILPSTAVDKAWENYKSVLLNINVGGT